MLVRFAGRGQLAPFLVVWRDVHLDITASLKVHGIVEQAGCLSHRRVAHPLSVGQDHLLSAQSAAVIVFSARTLAQFQLWLAEYVPTAKSAHLTVLAASTGLAEQARAAGYPTLQAVSPDREAVLQLSVDWFQQKFAKNRTQKLT